MVRCASIRHSRRTYEPDFVYPKGFDWTFLGKPFQAYTVATWPSGVDPQLFWQSGWSATGLPLRAEQFPDFIKFKTSEYVVQDFYRNNALFYIVNEKVKNKLNELEPGIHQFFRTRLLQSDGSEPWGPYYFLQIRNALFSIDVEKSWEREWQKCDSNIGPRFVLARARHQGPPKLVAGHPLCVVHSSQVIGNRHLWVEYLDLNMSPNTGDYRYAFPRSVYLGSIETPIDERPPFYQLAGTVLEEHFGVMMSDVLYDWIQQNDIKGLRFGAHRHLDTELEAGARL